MISLYSSNETNFNHNGICTLDSIVKICKITKELNGAYSVELEVTKDKNGKYTNIQEFCIIKVQGQLFRLYNRSNIQDTGISIRATLKQISTDIDTDFIEDFRAVDSNVDVALGKVILDPRFTILSTDMTNIATAYFVKDKPLSAINKVILDRWGGELYRDNFNIGIFSRIGRDTNLSIEYAKNILGFEQSLDYNGIITRMMPTGKDGCTIDIVNGGSKWIESPLINNYFKPFSSEIQFSDIEDATELKTAGESLWGSIDLPKTNYKVNFVALERTNEYKDNPVYKNLGSLELGDSVIIKHKVFGVNITARVIKMVVEGLTGKVLEIELGQFRNNILNIIDKLDYKIGSTTTIMEETNKDLYSKVNQTNGNITLEVTRIDKNVSGIDGRLQTAELAIVPDSIVSTVRSSTAYTNDLGEKVTSEQASAIAQTASNVKIGFNGISDIVDVDETGIKVSHGGTDYTKMGANGFKRHVGSSDKDYHYLFCSGSAQTPGASTIWIQLPSEFRGKEFIANVAIKSAVGNGYPLTDWIADIKLYVSAYDYNSGSFAVVGYWVASNGQAIDNKPMEFTYTANA